MSLADQQWCPSSVQVTVLQARGLRIKGKSGTNDAYAVMQVGKEKFQTSVVEKSVAPVWKEEAAFDLPPLLHGAHGSERGTLRVHVLHRALVGPDKLLGQAVIDLLQLSEDKTRSKTEWFKLLDKTGKPDKDRGEVLLDIQFMRNNMTASMFDLSAAGKSRSRLGKFKDKVRGKKKESDSGSNTLPSFTQVLTDSEDEANGGEGAASKDGKKKHKMKSLFSPKSNLQKNMSQSMSVLPGKNSTLSGSQSSGLNVDSSEGKKKFKFKIHKRSGSSDGKDSSSGLQKQLPAEQSNLCINGSHIYCEEPPTRTSRIGSNFSLASSGHGSMEEVPENSPPSVDSLRAVRQYSPWTEEDEEEVENIKEDESRREAEEERMRTEEEEKVRKRREELERLAEEEERRRVEEQKVKREEEERIRREEEERERLAEEEARRKIKEEEERRQREEEEKIRMEEERAQEERRRRQEEEEERVRREEEHKLAEERRRIEEEERRREEEERVRKEKEEYERLMEEKRKLEEEKERIEAEERRKRMEEERMRKEEQERKQREEEEERVRKEKEEYERLMEEKRKEEEEKKRIEAEEKLRKEEEERIRMEEERMREEEKEERERMQRKEEERIRMEEERMQREEAEKMRKEEEEKRKLEEQERMQREEEERIRKEEQRRREEEERMRKEKEEYERLMEEKRKEEDEKKRMEAEEKLRKEEEERARMEEERMRKQEEEERVRKEKEEYKRLMEEKRKLEEEKERIKAEEKLRKEEEERIRLEEERRRKEEEEQRRREEQERIRVEEEKRQREEEERRREEKERARKEKEEYERLERLKEEEERKRIEEEERIRREEQERIKMEEETRRQEEEERARKEKEEMERLAEERRRKEEEEEKRRIEEEEKVRREEEERMKRERKEKEEARRLEKEKLKRDAEERKKMENKDGQKAAGKKSKLNSSADVCSTNPFDENYSYNPFEEIPDSPPGAKEANVQQRCPSLGSKIVSADEKELISAQREKRPAPQPPGRNQAEKPSQREQGQINTQNKDKDVKTVSVPPQRSVQVIVPVSRSPADSKNDQSAAAKGTGKRHAPPRPRSVEEEPKTTSTAEAKPTVYGLNPFEDDEDEDAAAAPVCWPPAADKDAKTKSSKVARAPPPPQNDDTLITQNTEGSCVADDTLPDEATNKTCDPQLEAVNPSQVQESPVQTTVEAFVKKEGPPVAARRLQPVKPLNSVEQQSVSVVQEENKSTGILVEAQDKAKVNDAGLKGPFSQLTQEELISLVLKQENQLSERDKKISELEQYIDNLLVRVIEEQPSILMSLNSLKKAA